MVAPSGTHEITDAHLQQIHVPGRQGRDDISQRWITRKQYGLTSNIAAPGKGRISVGRGCPFALEYVLCLAC